MLTQLETETARIARDDRYISFPALVTLDNGDLLMAYRSGRTCYRDYPEALNNGPNHPHTDQYAEAWLVRSTDGGNTWHPEPLLRSRALFDADHAQGTGYQDVGFTKLPDGRVMLSIFRWCYSNDPPSADLYTPVRDEPIIARPPHGYDYSRYQPFNYAYMLTPTYTISDATGRNWSPLKSIDVKTPVTDQLWCLATRNGGVILDDETVGWPFYSVFDADIPAQSGCHMLRYNIAEDRWTYGSQMAVGSQDNPMEEPLIHRTPDGNLLGLCRSTTEGYAFYTISRDNGETWSPVQKSELWGYPFAALNIGPDTLLAYGYRRAPMGIRMSLLSGGRLDSFDPAREIIVRDDGLDDDSGYPALCQADDGAVILAYYFRSVNDTGPMSRYVAVNRFEPGRLF